MEQIFGPRRGPAGTSLRTERQTATAWGGSACWPQRSPAAPCRWRRASPASRRGLTGGWSSSTPASARASRSRRSPCRRRSSQLEACDTDVVRRLTRRPALARRYLAVEGHRALAAIEDLLPPSVRSLIDSDVAARADSPAASLTAALSRTTIAEPPDSFGAIRARHLLKSIHRADSSSTTRRARSTRAA